MSPAPGTPAVRAEETDRLMSGSEGFPPPGGYPPPPGAVPPGYQAPPLPGAAGPATAPGMLGAAHKPGAMPLRPLGLGDMYDAAFRIIRFNPKATVGSAVLVASVAMLIPVVVTAVMTWTVGATLDSAETGSGAFSDADVLAVAGPLGSLGVGMVLQALGTILVTGMVAHVTAAAAIGRRLTLGQAWAATRGKRWRLIGLALLMGLLVTLLLAAYVAAWAVVVLTTTTALTVVWGLVTVPAFLAFLCWFWIRFAYLPVPALMLEGVGVIGALGRGFVLTRRQFWRTFGIALLTILIASVAGYVLAIPISLVAQLGIVGLGAEYAVMALVLSQALSTVVSSAFVTPFTSSVTSLQYLDQRMRKEAYDVVLMEQAGITGS